MFCISGVFLHKLGGVYCDHGNKLMWRILQFSHRNLSQTFSYIPKMSRVKALGIAEKKIQRKIPVERTQSEEVYLASPSFQKDFLILRSLFLTYTKTYAWTTSNVRNIVDENQILTSTSGITCVHVSSEKKEFFRLDNEKWEIPI